MTDRWDLHFLELALSCARMSKDPSTIVGAVIVGPDKEIRATGFNGFPRGVADTPERLADRELKLQLIVHAECNAICNAARVGVSVKGCSLYLVASNHQGQVWGGAPCTRCTMHIIQAGIAEVVSYPIRDIPERWKLDVDRARQLLHEAHVAYREVLPA